MIIPEKCKILELCCGNGLLWEMNKEHISPRWEPILSDISPGMVKVAHTKLVKYLKQTEFLVIDAAEIPFVEKSFDVVIANHMLYHMDNLVKVLSEIRRVLTPEGVLYASTIGQDHFKELKALLVHS